VQGLVDRVAAQVQQGAPTGDRQALGLRRLFHPGLHAQHLPDVAGGDDLLDGAEVRVPSPVLVDAQQDAGPLRGEHGLSGRRCTAGERLVADDRQPEPDRLVHQLHVGVQRCGDHDRVHAGLGQLGEAARDRDVGEVGGQRGAPFRRPDHDATDLAVRGVLDQRSVEEAAALAVADQAEAHRRRAHATSSAVLVRLCRSPADRRSFSTVDSSVSAPWRMPAPQRRSRPGVRRPHVRGGSPHLVRGWTGAPAPSRGVR